MKFETISKYLSKKAAKVKGSERNKSGQSKIEMAKEFNCSLNTIYELERREKSGAEPMTLVGINDKNIYLFKVTHKANK